MDLASHLETDMFGKSTATITQRPHSFVSQVDLVVLDGDETYENAKMR
jgi:hypothetical protein